MQIILNFVQDYFVFMLVLFVFSYLVPGESYRKYFQYFIGALMVVILLKPLLSFGNGAYRNEFRQELTHIEKELSDMKYYEKGEDIFEQFLSDPGLAGTEAEKEE